MGPHCPYANLQVSRVGGQPGGIQGEPLFCGGSGGRVKASAEGGQQTGGAAVSAGGAER